MYTLYYIYWLCILYHPVILYILTMYYILCYTAYTDDIYYIYIELHSAVLCEGYEFGVPWGGAGAAAYCYYGHCAEEWGYVSTVVVGVVVLVIIVVVIVVVVVMVFLCYTLCVQSLLFYWIIYIYICRFIICELGILILLFLFSITVLLIQ